MEAIFTKLALQSSEDCHDLVKLTLNRLWKNETEECSKFELLVTAKVLLVEVAELNEINFSFPNTFSSLPIHDQELSSLPSDSVLRCEDGENGEDGETGDWAQLSNSNIAQHVCNLCDKEFKRSELLTRHIDSFHCKRQNVECDYCEKSFSGYRSFARHNRLHHQKDSAKYTCDQCEKSYGERYLLLRHKRVSHDKVKGYHCEECGKDFGMGNHLKKHLDTVHAKSLDFSCSFCSKSYPIKLYLDQHLSKHHSLTSENGVRNRKKPNSFICDSCGKSFADRRGLEGHVNFIHKGIKVYCHICGKGVCSEVNLKLHVAVHSESRPRIPCDYCDKTFLGKSQLTEHVKYKHEGLGGQKICEMCGKGFNTKSDLNKHVKGVHQNIRNHICSSCGKAFVNATHLKTHTLGVHQGIKVYKTKKNKYN